MSYATRWRRIRHALLLLSRPDLGPAEARQVYAMMERQIHLIVRLVDDLLDVSRVTRGKIRLRLEPVELADIIARAVETSRPLIEARGHHLHLDVPSETLRLHADAVRLAQVLTNLLNNAAKYTEDGGHIWLTAERVPEADCVLLTVRDTGIGVHEEMLPRLFLPFTQAEQSLGRSQGGLGIGLALARSLVELHGGEISAHSEGLGRGSEFTVRLPLLADSAGGTPATVLDEKQHSATGCRVLVVDDNVDAAETLALLMRHLGNEARTAHDGPSALVAAREFRRVLCCSTSDCQTA